MPSGEDLKMLRDQERQILRQTGMKVELISKTSPKAQWWKKDGTPLPNVLPADAYHTRRYLRRGWTMYPPEGVAEEPKVEEVVNEPYPFLVQDKELEELKHYHRFGREMGSVCTASGCNATRQIPFKKRSKRP
jgi:hypothetical protein